MDIPQSPKAIALTPDKPADLTTPIGWFSVLRDEKAQSLTDLLAGALAGVAACTWLAGWLSNFPAPPQSIALVPAFFSGVVFVLSRRLAANAARLVRAGKLEEWNRALAAGIEDAQPAVAELRRAKVFLSMVGALDEEQLAYVKRIANAIPDPLTMPGPDKMQLHKQWEDIFVLERASALRFSAKYEQLARAWIGSP